MVLLRENATIPPWLRDWRHQFSAFRHELQGGWHAAGNGRSRARIAADSVGRRMRAVADRRSPHRERTIHLKGGACITYRLNQSDMWTVREVWAEEVYRPPVGIEPRVMVDLGANIGLTCVWMGVRHGCRTFVAVEPLESNVAVLRRNLARNGLRAEVVQAAVAGSAGTGNLVVDPLSGAQGRLGDQGIPVPVVTMETVLDVLPPDVSVDLLKVDIEGAEEDLFTGDLSWLDRVRAILVEMHPDLGVDVARLTERLHTAGYRLQPLHVGQLNPVHAFVRADVAVHHAH